MSVGNVIGWDLSWEVQFVNYNERGWNGKRGSLLPFCPFLKCSRSVPHKFRKHCCRLFAAEKKMAKQELFSLWHPCLLLSSLQSSINKVQLNNASLLMSDMHIHNYQLLKLFNREIILPVYSKVHEDIACIFLL